MTINTKTIAQFVGDAITAAQGAASSLINTAVGSIFLAFIEAMVSVASWLQYEISALLQTTRASTSSGAALDSWMADYGLQRLPATFAQGQVSFARFTTGQAATIPLGTVVETADGSQQYAVLADSSHPNFVMATVSPSGTALTPAYYSLPPSSASITVPVQARVAGSAANVAAGQIALISGSIPFVDTVSNGAAISNGLDPETDAAFRLRFLSYIAGLARCTVVAVANAIESVAPGIHYTISEQSPTPGYFSLIVDNGVYPTAQSLLDQVSAAVNAVRPVGTLFDISGATQIPATVAMAVTFDNGNGVGTDVAAAIITAGQSLVNGLGLGQTLYLSRLSQIAMDASPAVIDVAPTGITINGQGANLPAGASSVIRVGNHLQVSVNGNLISLSFS